MERLRTVLLVAHFATLAVLAASAVSVVAVPRQSAARRLVAVSAVVMGLTGVALIGARAALDLDNNIAKLVVKAVVLVGVVVLARRLSIVPAGEGPVGVRLLAGIAALVATNTAIAVGWN